MRFSSTITILHVANVVAAPEWVLWRRAKHHCGLAMMIIVNLDLDNGPVLFEMLVKIPDDYVFWQPSSHSDDLDFKLG